MEHISALQAVVLGIVEGLTEFLPISSTGHLTIVEKLLGLRTDDDGVTGFTAVIQVGAIVAVLIYFRRDIVRFVASGLGGLVSAQRRDFDFRFAWGVVAGSVPIAVAGLLLKDVVKGPLRSLWVVAAALVAWGAVMWFAERRHAAQVAASERHGEVGERGERSLTLVDMLVVGVVQCVALVPGVSRSGATISAGLLRGLDRVSATRLSFFLSIPALVGAGLYELKDATSGASSGSALAIGTLVSFVVAYASIAFLLRFVSTNSIAKFVPYRVAVAVFVVVILAAGVVSAT